MASKAIKLDIPGVKKVMWPTDAQLAKLVFEKPLTRIAADLGVSDNAVSSAVSNSPGTVTGSGFELIGETSVLEGF